MSKKEIKAINMSDKTDAEMRTMMDNPTGRTALQVANFIGQKIGGYVAISNTQDGVLVLDFAINGQMQPSVRVIPEGKTPRVIWPAGSSLDLLEAFMTAK